MAIKKKKSAKNLFKCLTQLECDIFFFNFLKFFSRFYFFPMEKILFRFINSLVG